MCKSFFVVLIPFDEYPAHYKSFIFPAALCGRLFFPVKIVFPLLSYVFALVACITFRPSPCRTHTYTHTYTSKSSYLFFLDVSKLEFKNIHGIRETSWSRKFCFKGAAVTRWPRATMKDGGGARHDGFALLLLLRYLNLFKLLKQFLMLLL